MIKRRGNRGGRPPINTDTKQLVWRLYDEDKMTCQEIARACNISVSSLYRIMRERGKIENGG